MKAKFYYEPVVMEEDMSVEYEFDVDVTEEEYNRLRDFNKRGLVDIRDDETISDIARKVEETVLEFEEENVEKLEDGTEAIKWLCFVG